MAIAHAIESKTEAAYRRGDLYMKRLDLMEHGRSIAVVNLAKFSR